MTTLSGFVVAPDVVDLHALGEGGRLVGPVGPGVAGVLDPAVLGAVLPQFVVPPPPPPQSWPVPAWSTHTSVSSDPWSNSSHHVWGQARPSSTTPDCLSSRFEGVHGSGPESAVTERVASRRHWSPDGSGGRIVRVSWLFSLQKAFIALLQIRIHERSVHHLGRTTGDRGHGGRPAGTRNAGRSTGPVVALVASRPRLRLVIAQGEDTSLSPPHREV